MTRFSAQEAAIRYAAANKSDPFAYNRAMSHIKSGLTKPIVNKDGSQKNCDYDAQERTIESADEYNTRYIMPGYTNIQRP